MLWAFVGCMQDVDLRKSIFQDERKGLRDIYKTVQQIFNFYSTTVRQIYRFDNIHTCYQYGKEKGRGRYRRSKGDQETRQDISNYPGFFMYTVNGDFRP